MRNRYGENTTTIWTDRKRFLGMPITFTKYSLITNNIDWTKLFIKTGILTTTIDEINLYRIYDVQVTQGLIQKILGVGTITLHSKDVTHPTALLLNIKDPFKVRNLIAEKVEHAREVKGVRIGEFY